MTLPPKDSNDPLAGFFPLRDPQHILKTNAQVTPLLPRARLESMIDLALAMPQHKPVAGDHGLPPTARRNHWSDRGRVSGVLAAVACCVLFFAVNPQTIPLLNGSGGLQGKTAAGLPQISADYKPKANADSFGPSESETFSNAADVNDLLLYDFLESL